MAWHAAIHKETEELMWTQNPQALGPEWECKKISRAPTEFDDFDREAGRLKQNAARKAQAARNNLTLLQRVEKLEELVATLMAKE